MLLHLYKTIKIVCLYVSNDIIFQYLHGAKQRFLQFWAAFGSSWSEWECGDILIIFPYSKYTHVVPSAPFDHTPIT